MKPERKLDFTTDEGTWLSVAVSPDGKTIALDLLGDLYTLPITGGEAKPIATGLPFDGQPKFSPDGKRIAFTSDRDGADNLWIANADGTNPKQLSKDQRADFISPTWTPDGEYVIVSRNPEGLGTHEIWMYNINGGSGVQVTKSAATPTTPRDQRHNDLGPIASPDGKYFYFARRNNSFTYNVTFPLWQIVRRDRVTGDEDTITREPGSAFRPVLSPDGKKLVYGTRVEQETGLRIRDLESGEERWLKYPIQRDDQESRATRDVLPGYAFTPDGKEVIAFFGGKINRIQVATGESTVIPFTAHVSLDLGPLLRFESRIEEGPVRARLMQAPTQSPDGKRIAFSSLTHLYEMDIPGGKPARIDSGAEREYMPAWSPDGQYIAYVTWSTGSGGHVWKKRADGQGQPEQLTRVAGFYQDPVWSPDGSRIVALRGSTQARMEALGGFGGQTGMDWSGFRSGRRPDLDRAGARRGTSAFHARQRSHLRLLAAGPAIFSLGWHGPAHASQGGRKESDRDAAAATGTGRAHEPRQPACAGVDQWAALHPGRSRDRRRCSDGEHELAVGADQKADRCWRG